MRNPFKRLGAPQKRGTEALPYAQVQWERLESIWKLQALLRDFDTSVQQLALIAVDSQSAPVQLYDESKLCTEELIRADQYADEHLRSDWVISRVLLRYVLSFVSSTAPEEVELKAEPCTRCAKEHGKPFFTIVGAPTAYQFSLSHVAGSSLLAIGTVRCGVDLEQSADERRTALVASQLHPLEQLDLEKLTGEDMTEEFTRIWVRKEALLKADGRGLSVGFDDLYCGVRRKHQPHPLEVVDGRIGEQLHWALAAQGLQHTRVAGFRLSSAT